MQILTSFFDNDISIYKKIENGFNIVFETNMYTDKNKIKTYLDDDEHFWLILSHNIEKKYGTCDKCREEKIKISDHKCRYDFIIKNVIKVLTKVKL